MKTEGLKKAVFIDRDGTLIEEVNYLSRVEELSVFPFTPHALRRLKDAGYLIVVVTNQSGIGRGIYDETAMNSIHDAIQTEVGGAIDAFYHCPHLPCDGCSCRKPMTGMLDQAASDLAIDISRSWMIGDKKIDVETGFNAGARSALVMTGYGAAHRGHLDAEPEVIAEDLLEAAEAITRF